MRTKRCHSSLKIYRCSKRSVQWFRNTVHFQLLVKMIHTSDFDWPVFSVVNQNTSNSKVHSSNYAKKCNFSHRCKYKIIQCQSWMRVTHTLKRPHLGAQFRKFQARISWDTSAQDITCNCHSQNSHLQIAIFRRNIDTPEHENSWNWHWKDQNYKIHCHDMWNRQWA